MFLYISPPVSFADSPLVRGGLSPKTDFFDSLNGARRIRLAPFWVFDYFAKKDLALSEYANRALVKDSRVVPPVLAA